jgi:hypothetical protein
VRFVPQALVDKVQAIQELLLLQSRKQVACYGEAE